MTECDQTRTDTPSVSDEERQRIERMLRDIVCRLDADAADDVHLEKVEIREFSAAASVRMRWQLRDRLRQGFGAPGLAPDCRVNDAAALQKNIDGFRAACDLSRYGETLQPPARLVKGSFQREISLSPVWFWEKQCTSCSGTGRHICPSCGGRTYRCTTCDGTGKIRCRYCGGRGHKDCKDCYGSGYTNCSRCGGRGIDLCHVCGGYGSVSDFYPSTRERRCYNCGGSGTAICFVCHGRGEFTCRSCSGSGKITCAGCGGSGHEICTACEGGGFAICSTCGNSGFISCTECRGKGAAYGAGSVILLLDTSISETWITPPPETLPIRLSAQRRWILQTTASESTERQWHYKSIVPFLVVHFLLCGKEHQLFMAPGETLSLADHEHIFADFRRHSAARLLQTRPDAPPLTPRYERQARQWKQLLERFSVNERLWSAAEREAINELDAVSCFWLWTRSFICCLFLAVGLVFLLRLAGADAALWSLAAWPCAVLLRRRLHRRLEQAVPMRQIPDWLDIAGWTFLGLATLLL